MKIYQLTALGKRISRSSTNPDNTNWKIIYALKSAGFATSDQLAVYTGLDEGSVQAALGLLKRKGIVEVR